MKLKQLIDELTEIHNEYGDLDVIECVKGGLKFEPRDNEPVVTYYSKGKISWNPKEGEPVVWI